MEANVGVSSAYLHALNGRIRIKLTGVKGSPVTASLVEERLHRCDGVVDVTANPITGNVLIIYDPARVKQAALMEELRPFGAAQSDSGSGATARPAHDRPTAARRLAETVMSTVLETAMHHLVTALI
jgi:Ca2+-transporting ATPase